MLGPQNAIAAKQANLRVNEILAFIPSPNRCQPSGCVALKCGQPEGGGRFPLRPHQRGVVFGFRQCAGPRLPADPTFAVQPGLGQTSPSWFPQNFSFKLRENGEQASHRSTGRGGQVQCPFRETKGDGRSWPPPEMKMGGVQSMAGLERAAE